MSIFAKRMVGVRLIGLLGATAWWLVPCDWGDGKTGEGGRRDEQVGVGVMPMEEGGGEAGQFPEAEYPAIATERLIRVSLGLMAKNGVDLSQPMASKHRVLAASPFVVEAVAGWARSAGYEATESVLYHEHGGVERYQLDLVRTGVPEPRVIEAQGREVFAAIGRIPGAQYQSWMGGQGR